MPQQPKYQSVARGADVIDLNTGKPIYSNEEPIKPDKVEGEKNVGSYVGKDGYNYERLMNSKGEIRDAKSENQVRETKGTTVNVNTKDEKPLSEDQANTIDAIKNPPATDRSGNKLEPERVRQNQWNILKNTRLGKHPRALSFMNNEIKQWTAKGGRTPNTLEFTEKILKALDDKRLTEAEATELRNFMPYYDQVHQYIKE
jgi:hypothetical protein